LRGSATPAPTFVHLPTVPGRAHDTHEPVQGESQQTPSTQLLNAQCVGAVGSHAPPLGIFETQLPPLQYVPLAQSPSPPHAPPHAPDEHR